MSWDEIDERRGTAAEIPAATISLFRRGGYSRPVTVVSLRRAFAETLGWKNGAGVAVAIGRGDNAGKLRLSLGTPRIGDVRLLKRNAIVIDLGFLPEAGGSEGQKAATTVRKIDATTIELDLPDWATVAVRAIGHGGRPAKAASGPATDEAPAERAAPPSAARREATAALGRAKAGSVKASAGGNIQTMHGVTVNVTPNDETIAFGGRETELTTNQAALALVLLRAAPNFVGHLYARDKVLGARAPRVDDRFAVLITDLYHALRTIGLELVSEKGHGLRLKGTDADE